MLSLNEKLELWVKITGVNPQEKKNSYIINMPGKLDEYDIEKMNDRITESLEYDNTGLFAEAYLGLYLKKFIDHKTISIADLLDNEELSHFIEDVKTLYSAIKEEDAASSIMKEMQKAMSFYGFGYENLDLLSVLEIRTSAIKCINKDKLILKQFSTGKFGDDFKLSKNIYAFKSLDDLIVCSAKGKLNGISLGYIEDKEDITCSYFGFIIKNGDNLYFLSDMPKYTHPIQKGMSRCPGRRMSERIESNFFPYDTIANLDVSDLWNSGRYGIEYTKNELSTTINEDAPYKIIGTLDMLTDEEAFWTIMMTSLIEKKFYKEELPKLELTYTNSMINSNLIAKTENALVVQSKLPFVELKEITDVRETDNLDYKGSRTYEGEYDYLIERYKDKIDSKLVLNIIKETDNERLMLEDSSNTIKDTWGKVIGHTFEPLNFDYGTTKSEMEYNQKWIARYNYARAINKVNKEDYDNNKEKVMSKIKDFLSSRLEDLVVLHLKNEIRGKRLERFGFDQDYTEELVSLSKQGTFDEWYNGYYNLKGNFVFYNNSSTNKYPNKIDYRCVFDETKKPSVVIQISCKNADELAFICGVSKEELPIELQHYEKRERYYGNNLLDNIDPFATVIHDEFNKMSFTVDILLSKQKYKELCTKANVEYFKFWEDITPTCYKERKWSESKGCDGKFRYHYPDGNILNKKCETCKWYVENYKE